ncbi:uncharacterized protein ARMOST_22412 [Armillaria ostoyae]|uniref:Uncharacterized protein n=1 Tax=Armillaria ostoyae TaxID=47428 RepID=A0A284SCS9_ARMOS|nr:uncharacterized protein ARMOST_22412 [Armillaria ostoyae]
MTHDSNSKKYNYYFSILL